MSQTSYTVLARRFRPQTFDDVVGQEHVGQALRNAILSGRVAHAYLFTGARGVGKTSTARIFAKALNCPHAVNAVPCNDCDVCQAISAGSDVDVLEIDGASNRGIDDIRQLRANVNVKSMRSRCKVYIIDEVHMLTREAFNALLKTLEEPPPNVKFVFCTTEANKVPDTILSRCQRFDFGAIAADSIAARLRHIAAQEGVRVDDEAIELVARRAAGSMRDSQSLFDQLLAFGEEHITTVDVHRLLGTAPDERLLELFDALIARDRPAALRQLDDALHRGVQLGPFSDQLLEYLRDLLVVLVGAESVPLASVGDSRRTALRQQGEQWGLATVTAAMQILAETKSRMQRATYGRALLELALIRISLLEDLDSLSQLIGRLESAGPAPTGPGRAAASQESVGAIASAAAGTPSGRKSEQLRQRLGAAGKPAPADEPPPVSAVLPAMSTPRSFTADVPAAPRERPSTATSATAPVVAPAESRPAEHALVSRAEKEPELAVNGVALATASAVHTRQPAVPSENISFGGEWGANRSPQMSSDDNAQRPAPIRAEDSPQLDLTPENVDVIWAQLVQQVPDTLASHLKNAENLAISGPNTLEVSFPRSYLFSMNYCQRPETLGQLERQIAVLTGTPIKVVVCVESSPSGPVTSGRPDPARSGEDRLRPKVVENDSFVQMAVSVFGGSIVSVRKILDDPHHQPQSTQDLDEDVDSTSEPEDLDA